MLVKVLLGRKVYKSLLYLISSSPTVIATSLWEGYLALLVCTALASSVLPGQKDGANNVFIFSMNASFNVQETFTFPWDRCNAARLLLVTWHMIVPLQRKNREQAAEIFLSKGPTMVPASVWQWPHTRDLEYLLHIDRQTHLPPPVFKTLWGLDILIHSCQWWTPGWQLDWRV